MLKQLTQLILDYMKTYGLTPQDAVKEIRLDLPQALTLVRDRLRKK